jgi:hypothetical protein
MEGTTGQMVHVTKKVKDIARGSSVIATICDVCGAMHIFAPLLCHRPSCQAKLSLVELFVVKGWNRGT